MAFLKVSLVAVLVVAILAYMAILTSGGGLMGWGEGFQDARVAPNEDTFTLFWMEGCPHCEDIIGDFKRFAAAGQFPANGKRVTIRALERKEAGGLLDTYNVDGFPTLILSTTDGRDLQYSGERTVNGYKEFILKNVK